MIAMVSSASVIITWQKEHNTSVVGLLSVEFLKILWLIVLESYIDLN